jgi:hypothetical protein
MSKEGCWGHAQSVNVHQARFMVPAGYARSPRNYTTQYDIVCREPATKELCFSSHTIADWGMFNRETMLLFLEGCCVKIGGPNKTVEIDESKFGRRKYHRGHPLKCQWVFGGVERESGVTFLLPVKDRTADTLMTIIRDWIESGTKVISDCWGAYRDLGTQGYTHQTVNHSIHFVDPGHTQIPSRARGSMSRFSSGSTTAGKTMNSTSHTTCSLRGQGTGRTTIYTITEYCRKHRLVPMPASSKNCLRHVLISASPLSGMDTFHCYNS